jgi:hypothetical protein
MAVLSAPLGSEFVPSERNCRDIQMKIDKLSKHHKDSLKKAR